MNRQPIAVLTGICVVLTAAPFNANYVPGSRILVLAHNAYPDHGKYADRLDRAISVGLPFAVEEDLTWTEGRSLLVHGPKNAGGDDPTLEGYFFPKVKPIIEKALAEGNKGDWPLITLYLDIKNDPVEHLEAVSKVLDKYDSWLTTAVRTSDITKQSPLVIRPMMVLVEDKHDDIKQQFFHDRVPIGGKLRVFGSLTKYNNNVDHQLSKVEAVDGLVDVSLDQITTKKADNYRRWWGIDWAFIEKGGQTRAGEWNKDKDARLKKFVDYGHSLGYFVSVYCLSGWAESDNQGWEKEYNFGSRDAAKVRWEAAIRARADFIATDHYEELAKSIKNVAVQASY